MDISFYTAPTNLDTTRGYGNAGFQVVTSLQELGHRVPYLDPSPPVQISMNMPTAHKWHPNQYRIGYTPWESTELPKSWLNAMDQCDEVWATSQWVADVYEDAGVAAPIHVYEHGLDPRWSPFERKVDGVVNFLHVGEPALRKGGQMAVDAFREAFGDRTDVHLTVKAYFDHFLRTWTDNGFEVLDKQFNNVTIIKESVSFTELLAIYREAHVLVYPSYGEGFGFIPLQALGTGMPVISTGDWAPYRHHITWEIPGTYNRSIWSIHPGNVFYPDYDELVQLYLDAFDDIENALKFSYLNAWDVHEEFNWLKKTEKAFEHIVQKFS